jgi:3-phosphoshikimate 1-carboxyvinyltransferase
MSDMKIRPLGRLRGIIPLPGDKSISHRLAMIAAVAEGETRISNFSSSADCHSSLHCLKALGVTIGVDEDNSVSVQGRGLRGWLPPQAALDAGNSGSTMRMIAGLLAGQPFSSTLIGDHSLSRRPMGRIIEPLTQMGARFEAWEQEYPPLTVHGGGLTGIRYSLPVPSAQVKSAILLAGLLADGMTEVLESSPTRNHTEIALCEFNADVTVTGSLVRVVGKRPLKATNFTVPGDSSAAAFWIAAGLLIPDALVEIPSVGLNPSRRGFIDILKSMGGDIQMLNCRKLSGEPVGDLIVRSSEIEGGLLEPNMVPNLIDELPVLAVIGARSRRGIEVRGARELRVKESDRLSAIVQNLRALGVEIREFEDGFMVSGNQELQGAVVDSFSDHRIAMAFSIAGLLAKSPIWIKDVDCVRISFPTFYDVLESVSGK